MRVKILLLCVYLSLTITGISQDIESPAIVGERNGNLLLLEGNNELIFAEGGESVLFHYPLDANRHGHVLYQLWSRNLDELPHALYVYDGEATIQMTTTFVHQCPAHFIDDEHIVYVSNQGTEEYSDETGAYRLTPVLKHNILTGETQEINTVRIPLFGGGGGGTSFLPDLIAEGETVSNGFFTAPSFFEVLDESRLVSGNFAYCGAGLKIIRDAQQSILSRDGTITLAPSAEQAAVLTRESDEAVLRIYELDTGNSLRLNIANYMSLAYRHALYWADDNMLYLTASEPMDFPADISADTIDAVSERLGWDWDEARRTIIYQINPANGRIVEFHRADHVWAIIRLESHDGYLYWAEVPDTLPVIEAYLNGEFDNNEDVDSLNDYLLPNIYRMPFADGTPELVAENLQRFITR